MAVTYRFLFDECLCLQLTPLANSFGFEATSVRDIDRLGASDPSLALYAVEHDWVYVTNNRDDYVRIYARFELHCGLVVLLPNVRPSTQQALFARFLEQLPDLGDITCKLVEIDETGGVCVLDWPPARRNDDP